MRARTPLNSPPYYAPYNGAIEQCIRELKQNVGQALPVPDSWNVAQVGMFVAVAAKSNYRHRRCLGGANAQDIYGQKQRRGHWSQRQRHHAFEWISTNAKAILCMECRGPILTPAMKKVRTHLRLAGKTFLKSGCSIYSINIIPTFITPTAESPSSMPGWIFSRTSIMPISIGTTENWKPWQQSNSIMWKTSQSRTTSSHPVPLWPSIRSCRISRLTMNGSGPAVRRRVIKKQTR